MAKIILTADRTVLSEYNDNPFFGFTSCMSHLKLPDWFFFRKIIPKVPSNNDGTVKLATLALRKLQTALRKADHECLITDYYNLHKVIDSSVDIVGISSIDPLGYAPGSAAMAILDVEAHKNSIPYTSAEFLKTLKKIRELQKKYKFKIIMGGGGAWQFLGKDKLIKKMGINHVFLGEAEITLPELVDDIAGGSCNKTIIQTKLPKAEEIPNAEEAVVNGIIEVARGCGRGCKFCATTISGKIRNLTPEHIMKDVKTNIKAGRKKITIQSEDFLIYKTNKNFIPNTEAILDLFKDIVKSGATAIRTIHASLSGIASNPELIEKVTKITKNLGQKTSFCQPGIETGSTRLMKKLMAGKLLPFKNEEWGDVVKDAFKIMDKNNWVSAPTMILGFPGEEKEDIQESLRVVKSLKDFKMAFATLFFVPIKVTSLKNSKNVMLNTLTKDHWILLKECWKHNYKFLQRMNIGDSLSARLLAKTVGRVSSSTVINFCNSRINNTNYHAPLSYMPFKPLIKLSENIKNATTNF